MTPCQKKITGTLHLMPALSYLTPFRAQAVCEETFSIYFVSLSQWKIPLMSPDFQRALFTPTLMMKDGK